MRTSLATGCLVLLLVLTGPGTAALAKDKHELGEAEATRLVAKAASVSVRFLNTLVALGSKVSRDDLVREGADVPLTLAVILLGTDTIDERDFKPAARLVPKDMLEALHPHDVRLGMRIARHPYASIVHEEYVQEISVDVNGRTATGRLRFRAPGVYEGAIQYTAFRDASGWRVLELTLPHSRIRTVLQNGRWRLHLPEAGAAADAPRSADLDLPRVGTVGPMPSARTRVVIRVSRDGWLRVPGSRKPLSLRALRDWLRERTRDPALREPDGSSRVDAVLEIDETTPWTISQWLMQTCADPTVKIYKIWLGARTAHGEHGTIATRLPKDRGGPTPVFPKDFVKYKLKVFQLERFDEPSDLRALYAQLKQLQQGRGKPEVAKYEIVAPPPKGGAVPHGYVVQLVDVCLAAGARDIVFEGAALMLGDAVFTSAEALRAHILELKKRPGVPRVRLNNNRAFVPADGGDLPPVPARGLVERPYGAGMSYQTPFFMEEEIEEVEEEVVEDKPMEEPVVRDAPFEGPADNGSIGIGGGAGGAFRGRGGGRKGLMSEAAKLRKAQDDAVDAALRWLAAHQSPNGGWSAHGFGGWCDGKPVTDAGRKPDGPGKALYDAGVTGLALQAFLGAGYTNRGRHPFAKVVSRGLRYLKNIQDPEGCFGPRSTQQYIYNHAMGALAMVEAYGMTGSPIFKGSAQRSLDFIALARNPYFAWRYGVKPGDNDTSVTGWMMLPLYAARLINQDAIDRGKPTPLTVDEEAFGGVRAWIDKVTDPKSGAVGYVQRGTGPARPMELVDQFPAEMSESMTAVGVVARIYTGEDPTKSALVKKGLARIAHKPPVWDRASGKLDMYYWHWGTLAMFQAGGEHFRAWQEAMSAAIVKTQRRDGTSCTYKGSWDPLGPWGADGGRVYSTALLALCLEVRYRYDRVFGAK